MSSTAGFVKSCIDFIKGMGKFEDAELLEAFPNRKHPYPAKKPAVALQAENISWQPAALSDFLGNQRNGEETKGIRGQELTFLLKMDVFVPAAMGAKSAVTVLERLLEAMDQTGLRTSSVNGGKITYERSMEAFHLPVSAKIEALAAFEKAGASGEGEHA